MFTEFKKLPNNSRIWIYTAKSPWSNDKNHLILDHASQFLSQWAAHGQGLLASAKTISNQILIIGINEAHHLPSGCSIDSCVRFVQELGQNIGIDFFNRDTLIKNDDQIQAFPLLSLKQALKNGAINGDSILIDTTIQTVDGLDEIEKPIKSSWANRFLPAQMSS